MVLLRLILIVAIACLIVSGSPGRKKGKGGRRSKKVGNGNGSGPKTCPGFPGYCSESYPGDTCLVVCAFGRNNVPVCQDDGTWTDEPRCIEHEPGQPEQVPGTCPGVPGYCSLDLPGGLCTFECISGPHIRSSCKPDGTWDPYPTCEGDVRETKDGCDPCPGPFGGPRNRTAEAGARGGSGQAAGKRKTGGNKVGGRAKATGRNQKNGASNRRNGGANRNKGQKRKGSHNKPNTRKSKPSSTKRKNNGAGKRKNSAGQKNGSAGSCPDKVLEACIDACPGANARIFGACVAGCSKRC